MEPETAGMDRWPTRSEADYASMSSGFAEGYGDEPEEDVLGDFIEVHPETDELTHLENDESNDATGNFA